MEQSFPFSKVFNVCLCIVAFVFQPTPKSIAADIRPIIDGVGDYRIVVIEGQIEKGDFNRFEKIIQENQGKVSGVYLFSPGGDFDEAMKIGNVLNRLELSSQAPMQGENGNAICDGSYNTPIPKNKENCTCASACFFIHIAAFHKGGTFLAVHSDLPPIK